MPELTGMMRKIAPSGLRRLQTYIGEWLRTRVADVGREWLRRSPPGPARNALAQPSRLAASRAQSAHSGNALLVLSASVGSGHLRAGQALYHAALTAIDGAFPSHAVEHIDVLGLAPRAFRRIYAGWYLVLVSRFPDVWSWLYRVTNDPDARGRAGRMRERVERILLRKLIQRVRAECPAAIVCTHFLPAQLLGREVAAGRLRCPVWVVVTDFDLHRMWVQPGVRGYFVAAPEVAYRLQAEGVPRDRIHATGIPVMPEFAQRAVRKQCAVELGLHPDRPTLLLMGGGAGLGTLPEIAARLMQLPGDFQLMVIAGNNAAALPALAALAKGYPDRLRFCGFTPRVHAYMARADLLITKPGGLTVSEALAMGLPMLLYAAIPGQEERNADFLLEQGAALKAVDATTLEYRVRHVLQTPDVLARMRERARALGQPEAAHRILQCVGARHDITGNTNPQPLRRHTR